MAEQPCDRCDDTGVIEVGSGNGDTSWPERCPDCEHRRDYPESGRARGDDDGQEYADPREEMSR